MKNILCYGDSNTWGNIAGSRNPELMLAKRFDRDTRWTGVLQKLLGNDFHVIEEGLNGRNTSFDETKFVRPSRNGLAMLPLILETHYPLDVVVLMLGTNDSIVDFKASVEQTTLAMQKMIHYIRGSHLGSDFGAPDVLLVAPAPIHRVNSYLFDTFFDDSSVAKTQELAKHYRKLADQENCAFLDAGQVIKVGDIDGVHFDADNHHKLAEAVHAQIKKMVV